MSQFLGFTKKTSTLPHVVWVEESKNSLGFEIEPNYDDVPMRSQCATEEQSSCTLKTFDIYFSKTTRCSIFNNLAGL